MQPKLTADRINAFRQCVEDGINSWVKAGEILVEWIDQEGANLEQIRDATGGIINTHILSKFEQLGRHQLVPSLLVAGYPSAQRIARLPLSEQVRAIDEGIETLIMNGDQTDTLCIKAENLSLAQAKQIISGSLVRSIPAQRAWIESEREKKQVSTIPVAQAPYKVSGKTVIFSGPCQLNAKELTRILSDLQA